MNDEKIEHLIDEIPQPSDITNYVMHNMYVNHANYLKKDVVLLTDSEKLTAVISSLWEKRPGGDTPKRVERKARQL